MQGFCCVYWLKVNALSFFRLRSCHMVTFTHFSPTLVCMLMYLSVCVYLCIQLTAFAHHVFSWLVGSLMTACFHGQCLKGLDFFPLSKILWFIQHTLLGLRAMPSTYCMHTHSFMQYTHAHSGTQAQIHIRIMVIWFWDKIKFTRRIMAQFRQIIILSCNHCDRLRASTAKKGMKKKKSEIRGSKEQKDRRMSLSFCLPTHLPKLVQVPDSIH